MQDPAPFHLCNPSLPVNPLKPLGFVEGIGSCTGPPDMNNGETCGEYRINRKLGAGGMATVYVATHLRLGREVALKVLDVQAFPSEQRLELRERFFLEATLASRLSHPNVVSVHDFGVIDELRSFIAMELIEGCSLEQHLEEQGSLAPAEAIRICIEAARALRAAHARGLLHRDLKPGNLMLHGEEPAVKLVDFGLVREVHSPRLTQQGAFVGTLGYMAPETFTERGADQRSDFYSLGVVLFECITGALPFPGHIPAKVMSDVLRRPAPRLEDVAPSLVVSPQLEALVAQLLAKLPNDRPQTADALIWALTDLPERQTTSPTPRPSPLPAPSPRFRAMAQLSAAEELYAGAGPTSSVVLQLVPTLDQRELAALSRRASEWNGVRHHAAAPAVAVEEVATNEGRRCAIVHGSAATRTLLNVSAAEVTNRSALRLAIELFEVLAAAHELGVVHGRLSPSGVLIEETGAISVRGPAGMPLDPSAPWVDPDQEPWHAVPADDVYAAAMVVLTALDPKNHQLRSDELAPLTRTLGRCLRERHHRPTTDEILGGLEALRTEAAGHDALM